MPDYALAYRRRAEGHGVSALAEPGATLLMLAFGPTGIRSVVGGVARADVVAAFPDWGCSRWTPPTPRAWAGR